MANKKTDLPYHLSQARAHSWELRDMVMVKLARAIEERGWTQTEAAKYLGVTQPRISDLRRGKAHKFTLDTLIEMLFALDKTVTLVAETPPDWHRSTELAGSREHAEAIAYYSQVILLDPRNGRAYHKRADAYWQLKQYDLAIGDYTRCIELQPDRPGMRENRANLYRHAGQYRAALQECDDLTRLFPDYSVHGTRGLVYMAMGDPTRAIEEYTLAIQHDPDRPGSYLNRAHAYQQTGHLAAAVADYDRVLELDPTLSRARTAADAIRQGL